MLKHATALSRMLTSIHAIVDKLIGDGTTILTLVFMRTAFLKCQSSKYIYYEQVWC